MAKLLCVDLHDNRMSIIKLKNIERERLKEVGHMYMHMHAKGDAELSLFMYLILVGIWGKPLVHRSQICSQ